MNRWDNSHGASLQEVIGKKVRAAIRSIIRDWNNLSVPLPVDPLPESEWQDNTLRYRIRGSESYEELQEHVIQFAGRVWQFKDGLIKWMRYVPHLSLQVDGKLVGKYGESSQATIETYAKMSLPLLLCADLYNTYKHYDDCNRSKYQPFLDGVSFSSANGEGMQLGICYDGGRRSGELLLENANPVKFTIPMKSGNHPVTFGDSVVVIGYAFRHWMPLVVNCGLLSNERPADAGLLGDISQVIMSIGHSSPFASGEPVVKIGELSESDRRLVFTDPTGFIHKRRVEPDDAP